MGRLDGSRAREIARAVLEREVFSESSEQSLLRIGALRGCTKPLYAVLEQRAQRMDDVGAEATLILLEEKKTRRSFLRTYGDSADGAWRAVAARDTEDRRVRAQRIAFFHDADVRVRRAALRSALATPDVRELDDLLEISRVDPDPVARQLAIGVLGRLGTERAIVALKDRWERADERLRLAIVDAWSESTSMANGGARQLLRLVENDSGAPAIRAARTLIHSDGEPRAAAEQKLLSIVKHGSTEERRGALLLLPPAAPEVLDALKQAATDADPEVMVLANARLLEFEAHRTEAQKKLREVARGKGSAALQARGALAAIGDASVAPLLVQQLQDGRASHRKTAALGLIRLERFEEMAVTLADSSPSVRTDVACALLRQ